MFNDNLKVVINGVATPASSVTDYLTRAVIISLFTWRRANKDDALPSNQRMGWWADSFPSVPNDRIGSRLWLLSRAKMTNETLLRAKEYSDEALRWMLDDGVAARIDVVAERAGMDTLAIGCRIYKADGSVLSDIRFSDVWGSLNV